jgi:hypothetical protein
MGTPKFQKILKNFQHVNAHIALPLCISAMWCAVQQSTSYGGPLDYFEARLQRRHLVRLLGLWMERHWVLLMGLQIKRQRVHQTAFQRVTLTGL